MLLQFTVENAWSFRDRTTFSMVAAPGVQHTDAQVVHLPGGMDVLRVAALYGANASGKSNLVKAMQWAVKLIAQGVRPGKRIPVPKFKLADSLCPTSHLEFELFLGGEFWSYGLVVQATQVEAEWLYRRVLGKEEQLVFQRSEPKDGQSSIVLGKGLLRGNKSRRDFIKFVREGTRIEQPFVSECVERSVSEILAFTKWFRDNGAIFAIPGGPTYGQEQMIAMDPELQEFVVSVLAEGGTGIEEIGTQIDFADADKSFAEVYDEVTGVGRQESDLFEALVKAAAEHNAIQLLFRPRRGVDINLKLDELSDGTRRLMSLSMDLFLALRSEGKDLIIIDEIESSLHPLLTQFFIKRFLKDTTDRSVQLIFTTHDTNLLDLTALPRDSIWFAEKNREGATSLYSLAEFKGEQLDQLTGEIEHGYLQGRFGAIPFLGNTGRLGWLDRAAK